MGGAGQHGAYEFLDARPTAHLNAPSFTLSAIAEDYEADEDGPQPDGDAGYVLAGVDAGAGDMALDCDPLESELCSFAIIPPAPLSTVFEETDCEQEEQEEYCCAPSGSCHSADAGLCSTGTGRLLPHSSSLVRGLSAPSCASSIGCSGAVGGAAAAITSSAACTASRSAVAAAPAAPARMTPRTAPRVSSGGGGAAAPRSGGGDSMAVWYF